MGLSFVRQTFRLDDTFLARDDTVVVLMDARRRPRPSWERERIAARRYSAHQYAFLLHVAREFVRALECRGVDVRLVEYADEDALAAALRELREVREHDVPVKVDRVYDPAHDAETAVVLDVFPEARQCDTLTLVAWHDHHEALDGLVRGAFAKQRALRQFARDHLRDEGASLLAIDARAAPASDARTALRALLRATRERFPDTLDFDALWGRDGRLDDALREYMDARCQGMRSPAWHKPDTAADVGILEFSDRPHENTSKLSPFLAVGALSPFGLLRFLQRDAPAAGLGARRGSATDQLLFRELWYAHAAHDAARASFWSDSPGWWDPKGDYDAPAPRRDAVWADAPAAVRAWCLGEMDAAWRDANASMRMLDDEGWIHHLRRHLVADVLCRGELGQHFLYGEAWFRRTEIDHDAVLNRANWLWLSANAFSWKQKSYYHYSPVDFVRRRRARGTVERLAGSVPRDPPRYARWVRREVARITREDMVAYLPRCRPLARFRAGVLVPVRNRMERDGGASYTLAVDPLSGPVRAMYALRNGDLRAFEPDVTPSEMLARGVFDGVYLNDCMDEFPREWFEEALRAGKLTPEGRDRAVNLHGASCSQSLREWRRNGWIRHDARGWFQWYCRYFLGRRMPAIDTHQMKRWGSYVARHGRRTPKQRQALLHWGVLVA